jgi:ssDNA-binding Zn-finger/Zn-ribbon topoisomerase 1
VLGSTRLIQTLAASNPYWALFWGKVKNGFIQVPIRDVIADVPRHPSVVSAWESLGQPAEHAALPSLFVESATVQCPQDVRNLFFQTHLGSKLIVTARGKMGIIPTGDGLTYRESATDVIPQLAAWQGCLALPVAHDEWTGYRVPETTKKIAAIACGHLFQAQFEISDTHRLLCPKCSHRLLLKASFETAFLRCSGEFCDYSRSMSDQDANTLIEVQTINCPDCGARTQPRRAKAAGSIFLGCSNYPRCEGKVRWRDYADAIVR